MGIKRAREIAGCTCVLLSGIREKKRLGEKIETVRIKGLFKKYQDKADYAVRDISFDCLEGEIVGMVGRNGAGKSTILKCLTGLLPFSEGEIAVCGHDIRREPVRAKACFGYVPDVCCAFERMTGMEYLNFLADIYRISREERTARIGEFQEAFGLGDSIHNLIQSYSHGMKQKISVMASLIGYPKLWILDEPHTGLDPQATAALRDYMKAYAAKGNTVLFSSHNLDIVERICDRVVMIAGGRKVMDFRVAEFLAEGRDLEQCFLETCVQGGGEAHE